MAEKTQNALLRHDTERFYPKLAIKNNHNPNRLYAFPFIGLLIKLVMLPPVFVLWFFFALFCAILMLIVPFIILFKGIYWDTAFTYIEKLLIYGIKIRLFISGLSDVYPGFSMETDGIFEIELKKPVRPNKLLGFPLVGFVIRAVLLIPYAIYQSILAYGSNAAIAASWFAVTFTGKYPESLYEFTRDATRVSLAQNMYTYYLSDTYPSFWISMKHQTAKVILIILGTLLFISAQINSYEDSKNMRERNPRSADTQYNLPSN